MIIGFSTPLTAAGNDQGDGTIEGGSPLPVVKHINGGKGTFKFEYEWEMDCVPVLCLNGHTGVPPNIMEEVVKITGSVNACKLINSRGLR